jgi:hypothetical protein
MSTTISSCCEFLRCCIVSKVCPCIIWKGDRSWGHGKYLVVYVMFLTLF